jgi:hypothetical protein
VRAELDGASGTLALSRGCEGIRYDLRVVEVAIGPVEDFNHLVVVETHLLRKLVLFQSELLLQIYILINQAFRLLLNESVLVTKVLFKNVVLLVVERGQDPGNLGDRVDEFAELGVVASGDVGHNDCKLVTHLGNELVVHFDPQVAVIL